MAQDDERGRNVRHTGIVDEAAAIPSRAAEVARASGLDRADDTGSDGESDRDTGFADRGGAELRIDESQAATEDTLPPPSAHRADTMVRGVAPDARQQMERGDQQVNQASFTKGVNAPPMDQSRYPYTVEDMDELLRDAPRGLFPDTPGGDGATPLSSDRTTFLANMGDRGHFPSHQETEKWARAVFNALRECAIEQDTAVATQFADVVRVGEAPEVQVEEMMWGGDFLTRMTMALQAAGACSRSDIYRRVADEAGETVDDPWVDAAVHSFLGTLKSFHGTDAERIGGLGGLQDIWDRA